MVIEVSNVTKLYKKGRGVEDISFTCEAGEVFGLLGPNGSGKTTTMKVLTGLAKANSGTVSILGHDIVEETDIALSNVGSLIEAPGYIPYLSAIKNMKIAGEFYGVSEKRIEEIIEMVGLTPYAKDRVSKFSLGMKQRMGIALSLIGDPKVLILDEPSNGLDISGIVEIREIINNFAKKENKTIIISSHISTEIQKVCTKVGIMVKSKLIKIEKMDYILENYPSLEDYFVETVNQNNKGGLI